MVSRDTNPRALARSGCETNRGSAINVGCHSHRSILHRRRHLLRNRSARQGRRNSSPGFHCNKSIALTREARGALSLSRPLPSRSIGAPLRCARVRVKSGLIATQIHTFYFTPRQRRLSRCRHLRCVIPKGKEGWKYNDCDPSAR